MPHELHSKLVLVFLLLYDGLRKKRHYGPFFPDPSEFFLSVSPLPSAIMNAIILPSKYMYKFSQLIALG